MKSSVLRFVTSATTTALLSLDEAKAELDVAGSADDALLTQRIARVSSDFAGECNRANFGLATVEETYSVRPYHTGRLWLRHWPVAAIVSVREDGIALTVGDYLVGEERFVSRVDASRGDGAERQWRGRQIVVTYSGGFTLPADCPDDLRGAALTHLTASWAARGRDPMVKSEEVPGVATMDYWVGEATGIRNGFSGDVVRVLDRYRNSNIG